MIYEQTVEAASLLQETIAKTRKALWKVASESAERRGADKIDILDVDFAISQLGLSQALVEDGSDA